MRAQCDFCQIVFMRVADDASNSAKRGNLSRRPLRVTSGNHDLAAGIFAAEAPNGGPRILFSGGRNRASVENHPFCRVQTGGTVQSSLPELVFNGSAVGLRGATTEIFYVK